jgi:formimidoylglutamate deiminase
MVRNAGAPISLMAPTALLPHGWANEVLLQIEAGTLVSVSPDAKDPRAQRLSGPVLPGMANLHSHAFQRAMAGLAESAGPQGDSFWAWRELMYHFLDRLSPEHIESIARWLYTEMLEAGYTSVAEFHYLHHDPRGERYANPAETALAIARAADQSGIALTLLPVLYCHGNFADAPPGPGQKRFLHDVDSFARLCEVLEIELRDHPLQRLGVAPHSLRAVAPGELRSVIALADAFGADTPIHIHVAEQVREVEDCVHALGTTPIQWLAHSVGLDTRWCLVHATHTTETEIDLLAQSGAVAGLCPSTEGDLGDGFFRGVSFLKAQGRFGIGGDSHALVDPFMELRLFEYGQRLLHQRRNLLSSVPGASVGAGLFRAALSGGAQALAQPIGRLAPGARADLVVLDGNAPALAARAGDALLDAAIFAPAPRLVMDVMVGGRWVVRKGRHERRENAQQAYCQTLAELLA